MYGRAPALREPGGSRRSRGSSPLGKLAVTLLFEFSHDSLGRMAPQKFGASYRVFGHRWSPTTRPWPWKPL
jgi:hypothetical protein